MAAITIENVPAAHEVHLEAPAEDQVPAVQFIHPRRDNTAIEPENVPAGHKLHDDAASRDHVPKLQGAHAETDVAAITLEK